MFGMWQKVITKKIKPDKKFGPTKILANYILVGGGGGGGRVGGGKGGGVCWASNQRPNFQKVYEQKYFSLS